MSVNWPSLKSLHLSFLSHEYLEVNVNYCCVSAVLSVGSARETLELNDLLTSFHTQTNINLSWLSYTIQNWVSIIVIVFTWIMNPNARTLFFRIITFNKTMSSIDEDGLKKRCHFCLVIFSPSHFQFKSTNWKQANSVLNPSISSDQTTNVFRTIRNNQTTNSSEILFSGKKGSTASSSSKRQ